MEVNLPKTSLLDAEDDSQESESTTESGEGETMEVTSEDESDDEDSIVKEDDEASYDDEIISGASSSDSTASSEIPPPPPPDELSQSSQGDIPSDEEGADSQISKPVSHSVSKPFPQSVSTSVPQAVSKPVSTPVSKTVSKTVSTPESQQVSEEGVSKSSNPEQSKIPCEPKVSKKENPAGAKYKIAERLQKVLENDDPDVDRNADLTKLKKDYQMLRKKLKSLISATKSYQSALKQVDEARSKVFAEYAALSHETPLYSDVGKLVDTDDLQSIERKEGISLATTSEGLELQANSISGVAREYGAGSVASIQKLAQSYEASNLVEFQSHVLDYTIEWEKVITDKTEKELTTVKKLQQNRVHYERKVEGLRRKVANLESKGKEVAEPLAERLSRNELKLKDAVESHEHRAGKLGVLLQQETAFGWHELYPLVKNALKFEVNRVGRENMTYGRFPSTLDSLKTSYRGSI